MSKPILFTSTRPLERAENLKTVYDAYTGEKEYCQMDIWRRHEKLLDDKYALVVADEVPRDSAAPVLLIMHGILGNKLDGLDQTYPYIHPDECKNLVAAVGSSSFTYHIVISAFGVRPEQVHNLGMPRTDAYFNYKRESTGRVYLYAPTYRTLEEYVPVEIDWQYISDNMLPDEVMVVKGHMMETALMLDKQYPNIIEIASWLPTAPILMESDVVITDYSSVIFDGYVMRLPAVLFAKDKEHYLKTRGMYYPYPEGYSGRYCTDEKHLLELMRQAEWSDQDEHYRRMFCEKCDGNSTQRVLELIDELVL